jgi:hypothetical protein
MQSKDIGRLYLMIIVHLEIDPLSVAASVVRIFRKLSKITIAPRLANKTVLEIVNIQGY